MRIVSFLGLLIFSCSNCDSKKVAPKVAAALTVQDAGSEMAVVRFVAVGDTGKGNPGQHLVGASIATICEKFGCDFVTLLGDNFYPSGVASIHDEQWETGFVKPYASVNAPFYAVLGNHDYGDKGAGWELPRAQAEIDYSLVNKKWILPAHHYKFQKGPVDFFVADTNRSMFSLDNAMRSDFIEWLGQSSALWKIVLAHHPYKSNGRHGNAGQYDGVPLLELGIGVKEFVESEICGIADMYISGHDHELEWLNTNCTKEGSSINTEFVVSGAGATTTNFQSAPQNPFHWHAESLGFFYVVISGRTLTGTFYDGHGVEQFTRTITK